MESEFLPTEDEVTKEEAYQLSTLEYARYFSDLPFRKLLSPRLTMKIDLQIDDYTRWKAARRHVEYSIYLQAGGYP
jgi:hypothetical protein